MSTQFVHLNVHSDYSMIDGLNKVKPILEATGELNIPAIAITDHMNMCGLVKFYSAAFAKGIKPIIGCEINILSDFIDQEIVQVSLLATSIAGYKNITNIISKAYLQGHIQHKVVVRQQWLAEHSEGVILLSGGLSGDLGQALSQHKMSLANQIASFYKEHFGDRFYIEISRVGHTNENAHISNAVAMSEALGVPLVATNQVRFLREQDFDAHEVRVCISDGYTLDDNRRPKRFTPQQFMRSQEQMCELFEDIPEALVNSVEIAKRCSVELTLGEYFLPQFPTGDMSTEEFLVKVSKEGLERRLLKLFPDKAKLEQHRSAYDERLEIELEVINNMGFPGYFLIVMEFIQWSKDNNIPVGPGRGSGAGSLVAYALDITDLDPLEFDLLFERFLNPERVSMPDFDIDFCMDRRDEVIDHVAEMYGRDAVSQIITFGTMAAKAVIRDVGRVLAHPYGFVDRISKLIPMDPGMTLAKAFDVEPRLQQAYDGDEEVKELIDMARILEGVTRNAGKHAGGVVISPTTITDFSPLYCDDTGANPVTQFDKNDVETAGLVKFDFLGLRTLTIIQWALETIKQVRGEDIDITQIPFVDPPSFESLKRAETTAVFQLESRGMKDLIKRLQPDCFEDIIALVALFRPGPLQSGMVDNFIDRKHGREEISYPDKVYQHECLKEILEPTYGIILYQEQVMQIAQVMSGYSLGTADLLRRAMGKKKPEEMQKQRASFEKGAADNNIDPTLAIKIFDLVEKFAGYGFNKSHSAAYALVSYQTLWLKVHYPAEFMAAVLSADMDNTDKIVTLVDECNRMGLTILPPDVNAGQYKFTVNKSGQIVYGIGAIKGVGEGPVDSIIQARSSHGKFRDLFDFCEKTDTKKINKRVLEKLVLSGALDELGPHRAALMASIKDAMDTAQQNAKAAAAGQGDLFGMDTQEPENVEKAFKQVPPWSEKIWLDGEKETLGLYLTGHPINQYLEEIKHYTSVRLSEIKPTGKENYISTLGLVLGVRVMTNKKGKRWALVTLDDKSARVDIRLYPEEYEKYEDILSSDNLLWIKGRVIFDEYSSSNTINAIEILTLLEARCKYARSLELNLHASDCSVSSVAKIQDILQPYRGGTCPLHLKIEHADASAVLAPSATWFVKPQDELLSSLCHMLGKDKVRLVF